MHISDEGRKFVLPLTIIWLALTASMLIYGVVLYYIKQNSAMNMTQSEVFANMKAVLMPLSYAPFIFTFIFHKKIRAIVRKANVDKAPYLKNVAEDDRKALSYFGSYFVVHIILWAVNEAGAILGFILSMTSGDFTYYIYPACIAIFLNLVVMRPRYFDFIKGQRFE